jgi:hypothetical protein
LQRLSDGVEVLFPLSQFKRIAAGKWTIFAQLHDAAKGRLSTRQVAGSECLS